MAYFIKTIWGPDGSNYAIDNIVNFPIKAQNISERFKEGDGFLIYETGSERDGVRGNKTIFAAGTVSRNQVDLPKNTKDWGWAVRVEISKRVHPADGVPIGKLRKLGIKQFQIPGGLIPITDQQFDALVEELNSKH